MTIRDLAVLSEPVDLPSILDQSPRLPRPLDPLPDWSPRMRPPGAFEGVGEPEALGAGEGGIRGHRQGDPGGGQTDALGGREQRSLFLPDLELPAVLGAPLVPVGCEHPPLAIVLYQRGVDQRLVDQDRVQDPPAAEGGRGGGRSDRQRLCVYTQRLHFLKHMHVINGLSLGWEAQGAVQPQRTALAPFGYHEHLRGVMHDTGPIH